MARPVAAAAAALAIAGAGCGSGGSSSSTAATATTATTGAFCSAIASYRTIFGQLNQGLDTLDLATVKSLVTQLATALHQVADSAPASSRADLQTLLGYVDTMNTGVQNAGSVNQAEAAITNATGPDLGPAGQRLEQVATTTCGLSAASPSPT